MLQFFQTQVMLQFGSTWSWQCLLRLRKQPQSALHSYICKHNKLTKMAGSSHIIIVKCNTCRLHAQNQDVASYGIYFSAGDSLTRRLDVDLSPSLILGKNTRQMLWPTKLGFLWTYQLLRLLCFNCKATTRKYTGNLFLIFISVVYTVKTRLELKFAQPSWFYMKSEHQVNCESYKT